MTCLGYERRVLRGACKVSSKAFTAGSWLDSAFSGVALSRPSGDSSIRILVPPEAIARANLAISLCLKRTGPRGPAIVFYLKKLLLAQKYAAHI
jgi:hypothetical protein